MQDLEGCPWSHGGTFSFDLVIFASTESSGPAVAFIDAFACFIFSYPCRLRSLREDGSYWYCYIPNGLEGSKK